VEVSLERALELQALYGYVWACWRLFSRGLMTWEDLRAKLEPLGYHLGGRERCGISSSG
jgi:hypothetical protein